MSRIKRALYLNGFSVEAHDEKTTRKIYDKSQRGTNCNAKPYLIKTEDFKKGVLFTFDNGRKISFDGVARIEFDLEGEPVINEKSDVINIKNPKRTTGEKITQEMSIEERIKIYRSRYERGEYITCWDELPESATMGGYSQWTAGPEGTAVCLKPFVAKLEKKED